MHEISKNDVREIQISLLSYVDKLCRENNIDYSLAAGSLLGAVKYQAFIAWDDDVDLMLTRPNYNRLMDLLMADLPENFSLSYYKVQETFLPFTKLYDNRTTFYSHHDRLNQEMGVFIDIFPVDNLPDDRAEGDRFKADIRKKGVNLIASCTRGLAYASSEKWTYAAVKAILYLPQHLKYAGKSRQLAEELDSFMQRYNNQNTHYANFVYSFIPSRTAYFEKEIFEHYEDARFDNLVLRKISDHEDYLTELYGNWHLEPKDSEKRSHSYYHWQWKEPKLYETYQ